MAKLEDVLENFELRLLRIEHQLTRISGAGTGTDVQPTQFQPLVPHPTPLTSRPEANGPMPSVPREAMRQTSRAPAIEASQESRTKAQRYEKPSQSEPSVDSSSVLGLIGIAFVILAGVFFIKMAIDSNWLTPLRQVLIAAAAGLAFLIAPHFLPKSEKPYGALLGGAGVTILHLTWLGAYFFHHLLSPPLALTCATVIGVLSVFANFESGNRVYLLVAMAGTYLAAPLIGLEMSDFSTLAMFLVIWNISFSVTGILNRRRDLLMIASYYAVFSVVVLSSSGGAHANLSGLLTLQLIQFGIFSAALTAFSVLYNSALNEEESLALLPLLLLYYATTFQLVQSLQPNLAPFFSIAIGTAMLLIYFLANRFVNRELRSSNTLTTVAAMTFVHGIFFQLIDDDFKPLAGVAVGGCIVYFWSQSETLRKNFVWPSLVLLLPFFYGAVTSIISTKAGESLVLANMVYGALALTVVISFMAKDSAKIASKDSLAILLAFAHLEVMLGLYRCSLLLTEYGSLFVTLTWALYAVAILAFAHSRSDRKFGKSALMILLAVSIKAFFYDVANASSVARVGCLLLEGLFLYGCGWVFKKMQTWRE